MRDALNLLEHAISFSKNNITLNNINKMLGIPNKKNIYLLTKFLLEKDAKKMMLLLSKMEKIDIEWEKLKFIIFNINILLFYKILKEIFYRKIYMLFLI